jgi:crotonobetainyl-CoA:carnitine CoA-transferase CaiB-like acyl-CoA transferase
MAEVLVYADEWSSSDLAGAGREREFDIWTHPVLPLGDGTAVTLVGSPVRLFAQWTAALGRPELAKPDDDAEALAVIASLLTRVPDFASLEQRLDGHPMLVAEVRSVAELARTDWAMQRAVFTEIEPGTRVVTAPYRSEHAPIGVQGRAPRHGEHTRAVLAELLGLGDDELDALAKSGAIVTG